MSDADPFAETPAVGRLEAVGTPIDLTDTEPKLHGQLLSLARREDALANQGVGCEIKQRSDTSCHACPLSQHETDEPLGALCRVGREQEVVCTKLAVIACSP